MVLDSLGESLRNTLGKITKALFVDDKLINELVKDIQKALLQADVNVKLVLEITKQIKERAQKEEPLKGTSKKEQLIRIVYEELVNFLGQGEKVDIQEKIKKHKPYKLMLVGLFGSGKTTHTAKLANYYKKRGIKVAVITTDTWRPAAYDQLKQLSERINVPFFGEKGEKNPEKIFKKYEKELEKYDFVIIDTAGRDALNDELIGELNTLNKTVRPDDSFLVINADIGQTAEKQAKTFHDTCKVTGVIISKLDGTAKGGGSLIACSVTGAPVRFIGVGEKIDDLEEFKPEGFVGRLLGMGDLEALLEKTKGIVSDEQAQDMSKKLLKGDFNLVDLHEQMQAMKKMGPLNKLVELIPGFSGANIPKEMLKNQEGKIEKWKYLMDSMTQEELEEPDLITTTRIERISKGSGVPTSELRGMLKQYRQSKKLVKMLKPGSSEKDLKRMMQKMGGKGNQFKM